ERPVTTLANTRMSLVCGIAQPAGFARTVIAQGAAVGNQVTFPDHHAFSTADLAALDARLAGASAERVEWVTTEKDATKLRGRLAQGDRLWVLEMDVAPEPAARAFFFDSLRRLTIK
ncbi:MAG TPA: tetraacyldisaccharide 4'-kinase, partial [bacterium]